MSGKILTCNYFKEWTPLIWAAKKGYDKVVKILLKGIYIRFDLILPYPP